MGPHLRACAWLLGLTVVLCAVLYPLALLGIGQTALRHQADGSLLTEDDKVIGSRLIAQSFSGDEYFQPRPSAASYNGATSGASNWGASNPKLRDRIARQLGPMVEYRSGAKVGLDVEAWLTPERVRGWAKDHPDAAGWWFEADTKNEKLLDEWRNTAPQVVDDWKKANPAREPAPADLAVAFFAFYAGQPRAKWPKSIHEPIQAVFFDVWLKANPKADLEPVPADMVMASGSGLDPHITLDNALYQARSRVADARATKLQPDEARRKQVRDRIHEEIVRLLNDRASAPLGGLAGVPLVNVLEVNLALRDRMTELAKSIK